MLISSYSDIHTMIWEEAFDGSVRHSLVELFPALSQRTDRLLTAVSACQYMELKILPLVHCIQAWHANGNVWMYEGVWAQRRFSHLWCIDTGLSRALHLVFPRGTGSLKNISSLPFIIWRTFFHKEACVTQKGSSDVWRFVMEPFRQKTFFYGIVKHLYF